MDLSLLVQPITIVVSLLILNGFVFALYVLQYRKIKVTEQILQATLAENRKVVTTLVDDYNSHRKVLEEIILSSKGFEVIEHAQEQANEIIKKAMDQSERMAQSTLTLQNEAHERLAVLEAQAQAQLAEVVTITNTKAQEIIQNTSATRASLESGVDQALGQAVAQAQKTIADKADLMLSSYQAALTATQQEQMLRMEKINNEINTNAQALVTKFFEQMRQTILEVGSEKRDYMERELVKINDELQIYKKEQLGKIESNIYEILARASESVIGQAVNFDLHQELIIKALEQAKREGVFL